MRIKTQDTAAVIDQIRSKCIILSQSPKKLLQRSLHNNKSLKFNSVVKVVHFSVGELLLSNFLEDLLQSYDSDHLVFSLHEQQFRSILFKHTQDVQHALVLLHFPIGPNPAAVFQQHRPLLLFKERYKLLRVDVASRVLNAPFEEGDARKVGGGYLVQNLKIEDCFLIEGCYLVQRDHGAAHIHRFEGQSAQHHVDLLIRVSQRLLFVKFQDCLELICFKPFLVVTLPQPVVQKFRNRVYYRRQQPNHPVYNGGHGVCYLELLGACAEGLRNNLSDNEQSYRGDDDG